MPDRIKKRLAEIHRQNRARTIRNLESPQGPKVIVNGRTLLNFTSNDTLSLAAHPAIREAGQEAIARFGLGAGSARLLDGGFELSSQLEGELAEWLGAEAVLLFGSGYHANLGLLSTLGTAERRIHSDSDNHASIIDGVRLARGECHIYPHRQIPYALLRPGDLVVTESIFSMEGTPIDPHSIEQIERAGGLALVDEAHAFGWAGEGGRGLCPAAFARVGTFGKAFGSYGAFVAGSKDLIALLRSAARSFIFTTSLPAPVLAASLAALRTIRSTVGDELRTSLRRNCEFLRDRLPILTGDGPIFCLPIGAEHTALAVSKKLEERGILARAVRPPTVPAGECIIRLVVCAGHTQQQLEQVAMAINTVATNIGIAAPPASPASPA